MPFRFEILLLHAPACSCIFLRKLVYYRLFKGGLLKTLPAFAEFGMKDLLPLKINRPDEGCIRSAMMFPIFTLHLVVKVVWFGSIFSSTQRGKEKAPFVFPVWILPVTVPVIKEQGKGWEGCCPYMLYKVCDFYQFLQPF
jgi:hypothetical protein